MLELSNIIHDFSNGKQILKNLSLSLGEGQVYALMGSNGAGKTTLFNIISGFLKQRSGEILFAGNDVSNMRPYKRNRTGIGRTFQDLRIITKLSVKENIILSMKENPTDRVFNSLLLKSFHRKAIDKIGLHADGIVEQFFLTEVQNSQAGEISYGQQKLLTLACCVANGAKLLLLDEAVAGIQPEYRNKIAVIIKQLREQGKTILLIEHNTDFIADVADRIFFLHDGEISAFENMETLRKNEQVIGAYL
jgi:branched-chain amino acid transport system ATP-binding protein